MTLNGTYTYCVDRILNPVATDHFLVCVFQNTLFPPNITGISFFFVLSVYILIFLLERRNRRLFHTLKCETFSNF